MADQEKTLEKAPEIQSGTAAYSDHSGDDAVHHPNLDMTSWKYKKRRLGPISIPYYASPEMQLFLVSIVCFLCPGMFNALSGLGGAGTTNTKTADDANTALYATFAVVGFFAGTIANKLGLRISLSFGGLGYCIYCVSFLVDQFSDSYGFNIFAGFFLGCCAGILWCAQGTIMMSYPMEHQKGRFISVFWIIFNLGGVLGSLIPLGANHNAKTNATVSVGTYVGFVVLTGLGAAMAFTLTDAKNVVRKDGSRIIVMKNPTWKSEILGLGQTFGTDPYIILMFPMFLVSNWFTAYQFNDINAAFFDTRTRSLNGLLYWFFQMVGALVFGFALDYPGIKRTTKAKINWIVLMVMTMAVWGGGYAFQKRYTRATQNEKLNPGAVFMDWTDHGYIGPMFLYLIYGFYDAAWQTSVYWYMGSLTNNSRKLANFAGFYKGIQSAGAAITWVIDRTETPYMTTLAICWALLAGSLVIAAPVIGFKIKDTVSLEEDVKFSDETVEEVRGNSVTDLEHGQKF
ncbi:Hypothetical protein R9X50_00273600 [Acrodontium crateriforme]|uniref:MFS general substrate transporter n=1 Tax=Acrodontium crateriforme TaxID=150365 RepID=A0AAQ3R3Q1_9PEZI|nr:Hypothetical protein R9X50_00273600 [Acrodontium crateriforme]